MDDGPVDGANPPRGEKGKLAEELETLGGEDVCFWLGDANGEKRKAYTRMSVAVMRSRVANFGDDGPAAKRPRVADEAGCSKK